MRLRRRLPLVRPSADLGNHDVDDSSAFDFVNGDWPEADLHGRVHVAADGTTLAGLAGVFKGGIWRPTLAVPDDKPSYPTRASYLRTLKHHERWRRGLPLGQRDTIWPEDVNALGRRRADVLVTHKAPSTHEYGSPAIDVLAKRLKARLIVHGHHHRSYAATSANGIAGRGWVSPSFGDCRDLRWIAARSAQGGGQCANRGRPPRQDGRGVGEDVASHRRTTGCGRTRCVLGDHVVGGLARPETRLCRRRQQKNGDVKWTYPMRLTLCSVVLCPSASKRYVRLGQCRSSQVA